MPTKRVIYDIERVGPWASALLNGQNIAGASCIGLEQDGELIAGVLYDNYNGRSVHASIVSVKGRSWNREFLCKIFDYPFNQLKVNVILITVDSRNIESLALVQHMGFALHAVIPEAGRFGDLVLLSMYKPQCKTLTKLEIKNGETVRTSTT